MRSKEDAWTTENITDRQYKWMSYRFICSTEYQKHNRQLLCLLWLLYFPNEYVPVQIKDNDQKDIYDNNIDPGNYWFHFPNDQ